MNKKMQVEKMWDYEQAEGCLTHVVGHSRYMCGYLVHDKKGILPKKAAEWYNVADGVKNFPEWMVQNGRITPESLEAWYGLFEAIDRGAKYGTTYVTFTSLPEPVRYRVRFHGVTDEKEQPLFAMISFEDISDEQVEQHRQSQDMEGLTRITQNIFSEILSINLSKNTYHMVQYDKATTRGTPVEGIIDDMLNIRIPYIVPEDRQNFMTAFSTENLRKLFEEKGEKRLSLVYRRIGRDGNAYWFETIVERQQNLFNDDVIMMVVSRNIDQQKAEEAQMREQLRMQMEELNLTMSRIGKTLCYYDVPSKTLTLPSDYAQMYHLPQIIRPFPEKLALASRYSYTPEKLAVLQEFREQIHRGEKTGVCELSYGDENDPKLWERMEFATIFNDEGEPVRAVIAVEDTTAIHVRNAENLRLKANERVLQLIALHSERVIIHYDLQKNRSRFWNEAGSASPIEEVNGFSFFNEDEIPEESMALIRQNLKEIEKGEPHGQFRVSTKTSEGGLRWLDVKYSTLYGGEERVPVAALFSYYDITAQYEQEMNYLHHIQNLEQHGNERLFAASCDLTADLLEKVDGVMFPASASFSGSSLTDFNEQVLFPDFPEENRKDAIQFFGREHLLEQYAKGHRILHSVWKMLTPTGEKRWVNTEISMVADPYTGNIKASLHLLDKTDEYENQLAIQHQSEHDGMTGFLNRKVCEERIRQALLNRRGQGGVLMLVDLDDLKGINDTLGHAQGDRAIIGITRTLREHFRESDILGRIGGDELMLFLPGAAGNKDAIVASLSLLLRKVAGIAVGFHDERRIHCSIGCAEEMPEGDSFDAMYRRADLALYQVKRSGKNNFAFYSPEMEQADYHFHSQTSQTARKSQDFAWSELSYLIEAVSNCYPLSLSMNLSVGEYYLIGIDSYAFPQVPTFGKVEELLERLLERVHAVDQERFGREFSRKELLSVYERGKNNMRIMFRHTAPNIQIPWAEATLYFYINENGDVCVFALIRWAEEDNR